MNMYDKPNITTFETLFPRVTSISHLHETHGARYLHKLPHFVMLACALQTLESRNPECPCPTTLQLVGNQGPATREGLVLAWQRTSDFYPFASGAVNNFSICDASP